MGKLSIKQKAERYDKIIEIAKSKILYPDKACYVNINEIFPELVKSEDEQIRERLIDYFSDFRLGTFAGIEPKKIITWLEKQREPIDEEKVQIGARKDVALSIMNFLNKNTRSTCLSSMECADLEDAVVNSDWSKVYDYMKKKLENQDEPTLKTTEEEEVDNTNEVKLEELTDFETALVDICSSWIGKANGWKQYIKANANVLLLIAANKFNSVQDAPFEQESTDWKPTEEQIKALSIAIRCGIQLGSEEEKALRSLRKQLRELKKQEK